MVEGRKGSILAADFGSVTTRAVLIDIVDGHYRLVARSSGKTTVGYPFDDAALGLYRIMQDIGDISGRAFFDDEQRVLKPEDDERRGVDYFLATASAGHPVRAAIIGLMPDISVQAARRAMSTAYVDVVAELHLRDGRSEEERLNALAQANLDLIFIAGGTEGGATEALKPFLTIAKIAVNILPESRRPVVIYAGNHALEPTVRATFGEAVQLHVVDNVRPRLEQEAFAGALGALNQAFEAAKARHGTSFTGVGAMSDVGVLPTAQSYTTVVEYYARTRRQNVLALDIGSSSALLTGAIYGHINTIIDTDLGVGHSAPNLLEKVGVNALRGWLPFYSRLRDLRNYVLNKSLRPASLPVTQRELYIEQGLVRAAARDLARRARVTWDGMPEDADETVPVGLVLIGGAALTGTGHPAYDLMLAADTLQPTGITDVMADPHGMIPALGAIAAVNPDAAVQLLEGDALDHLGTLISVDGLPQPDKPALSLKITTEDGETFDHDVPGGSLFLLPLPASAALDIQIRAAGSLTVGGKRRLRLTLKGGKAGVLFDARGRAEGWLGSDPAARAAQMPEWAAQVTGEPVQPIREQWLVPIQDEDEAPAAPPSADDEPQPPADSLGDEKPARRGLFGRRSRPAPAPAGDDFDPFADLDADDDTSDLDALLSDDADEDGKSKATLQRDLDSLRDEIFGDEDRR